MIFFKRKLDFLKSGDVAFSNPVIDDLPPIKNGKKLTIIKFVVRAPYMNAMVDGIAYLLWGDGLSGFEEVSMGVHIENDPVKKVLVGDGVKFLRIKRVVPASVPGSIMKIYARATGFYED